MIGLIDYNMGNLLSVYKAVEQVRGDVRIIDQGRDLSYCDKVILPGVGNFGDGMEQLRQRQFDSAILEYASQNKPLLGICLGMQMLLNSSEEAPGVAGLGLIPGSVVKFQSDTEKIPHMGWNNVNFDQQHPFLQGLAQDSFFYFVHSFYALPENSAHSLGECFYINKFSAIIGRDKIFGTQFHPEKSQNAGLKILENFVNA